MSHSIDLFAVCEFADGHGRPLMANPANNVRGNDRIIDSPAPAFAAAEVRLSPSTRIFIRFAIQINSILSPKIQVLSALSVQV